MFWRSDGDVMLGMHSSAGALPVVPVLQGGSWLEFVDLPLWALAAVATFRISRAFRGGTLGRAARWFGWALLLVVAGKGGRMALLLSPGQGVVSPELGRLGWGLVLVCAWSLAGLGLYEFYRAGRSI